jgi:hypothetical protein
MPIYSIRKAHGLSMLVEFTAKEAKAVFAGRQEAEVEEDGVPVAYRRVPAHQAREWVRNRRPHMTALWNDNGRIRRAGGDR